MQADFEVLCETGSTRTEATLSEHFQFDDVLFFV